MVEPNGHIAVLIVRVNSRHCAFAIEHVIETMRPLAVEPIRDVPLFIRGLSLIRGSLVPVVDLGALMGDSSEVTAGRLVLLRLGERRVAIAVNEVLGVRYLETSALQVFPPLVHDALAYLVTAIQVRDQELLLILRSTQVIPDDVWLRLESTKVIT